jgi:hypothetical protein
LKNETPVRVSRHSVSQNAQHYIIFPVIFLVILARAGEGAPFFFQNALYIIFLIYLFACDTFPLQKK